MSEVSGRDLEAAAVALHRQGDYAGSAAEYERAHAAYRRDGDTLSAARTARTVGWFRGWIFGDWAVHAGWTERANTLHEAAGTDGVHRGWLLLEQARRGDDLETQRGQYESVIALAHAHGDHDLACDATASLGMMLVFSGHVDEGMRRLDETLAALCAGDVEELPVVEGCICGLFTACERTGDVRRAEQWLRAAADLISARNLVAVAGYCRAHYAGILFAAGRWPEAETELVTAIESLPAGGGVRAGARSRLAALRIAQGRLEEAAGLLDGLELNDDAASPAAHLHLALGRAELALEVLDRQLRQPDIEDHRLAPLLALTVEAHLTLGNVGAARSVGARLVEIGRRSTTPHLRGLAALAEARVRDDGGRVDCLRQAIAWFAEASLPFELARARLDLARELATERPEVARAEATAALAVFVQLGAGRDADAAASLLRSLGGPARTGPKTRSTLTRREEEVLGLLAHGLSNAQIGERLFISPKTVEHHVGRILSKLGVRSRTEAAVHALRAENPG